MTARATPIMPIKLRAGLHQTIWGGDNLARVAGKDVAPGAQVGESWETADDNVVASGPLAGATLAALVEAQGAALIGERAQAIFGRRFPLLAKFIDAHNDLSVQVHPDDDYARAREGGKLGKTEAWYVLDVQPGAKLVYGWRTATTAAAVRAAIASERLEDLLDSFEAHPGDVIFVPAGTVHAIGAGITLYELQEYSDVTYRLYDYGRRQADGSRRELHVDRALDVLRYSAADPHTVRPVLAPNTTAAAERRLLVGCPYFVLEEIILHGTIHGATAPASCEIVTVLGGQCAVGTPAGLAIPLSLGETAVLPAALGAYTLQGDHARLLRAYVPLTDDAPLALWRAGQREG
ncbi:MAG TPA: type I phosphomannose isomerase catalytic subunit [Ktedonobacterales bacterium]|nr:type I phosphomannose isomerase catalytic subunit [Ktedonobacterales bacterium]